MTEDRLTDELGRLAALHRYEVSETEIDGTLDAVTEVAQLSLEVPIVAVILADRDHPVFKSVRGIDAAAAPRESLFCAQTIGHRQPLVVPDIMLDHRFDLDPLVSGEPRVRSYLGVPLTTPDGYNIGALCAFDTLPRRFGPSQTTIMQNLARLVVEQFEMRQIAKSDPLTGALTRRGFVAQAEKDFARAKRYERPSSLLLVDIDNFKRINDRFGHAVGDDVLVEIVKRFRNALRQTDLVGRMGGEEFAVLLPETNAQEAMQCAERLRGIILDRPVMVGAEPLHITASFGVAAMSQDFVSASQWFSEADIALYEAKNYGRNKCVLARPERVSYVTPRELREATIGRMH